MNLSVIVPVYNGEKYLRECLESLTKQGFEKDKHEVLVINDGSTDGTEKIIDEFCEKYDYFVKLNKENGGVSSARNLGIEKSQGEYIAFIDGDDMFAGGGYRFLLDICYKEDLDGLYFEHTRDLELFSGILEAEYEKVELVLFAQKGCSIVCTNLFRSKIIKDNNLALNTEMKYTEDTLFAFYFTNLCNKVGYINLPFYYYRNNVESATLSLNVDEGETYGDKTKKEYLYYISNLIYSKEIKKWLEQNGGTNGKFALSAGVSMFLWAGLRNKYSPKQTLKDLEGNGLSVKDITIKNIEGNSFKLKLKSNIQYMFRYAWFYKLACWVYRIVK